MQLADYVEQHFGKRPTGAWLAERVWEPQLASVLAEADVGYTVLDDIHFLSAGFEQDELFGDYIAEDKGQTIRIIPGQKSLRYLIPWDTVDKVMVASARDPRRPPRWRRGHGRRHGEIWRMARHLRTLLSRRMARQSLCGLRTKFFLARCLHSPAEYLTAHKPIGRADLPTASYTEMMEWALPTRTRERYNALLKEFSARPEVLSFLRGCPWRGFFRKYSESNLLHKKMLRVAGRLAKAPKRRSGSKAAEELAQARDLLHRAQCNDAYWHGVFGGLYAPHLRTEISRNLIRAEAIADRHTPGAIAPRVETLDYDGDGVDELLFTAPEYQALVKPSDGGTLAALDFRPTSSTLINSILRRPEPYHSRLRDPNYRPATSTASAYEQTKVKETGLDRFLVYDRWSRHAFRIFLFDPSRTPADYEALELREDAGFAAGLFTVDNSSSQTADLVREAVIAQPEGNSAPGTDVSITKHFSFGPAPRGCEVACELRVKFKSATATPIAIGLESHCESTRSRRR